MSAGAGLADSQGDEDDLRLNPNQMVGSMKGSQAFILHKGYSELELEMAREQEWNLEIKQSFNLEEEKELMVAHYQQIKELRQTKA